MPEAPSSAELAARLRTLLPLSPAAQPQAVVLERHLSDGYTNSNHLLRFGAQRVVLRLGNPASKRLGIDRVREASIWRAAAASGLSPALLGFDTARGDAVSSFVDAPSAADARAAGDAGSVAQLAALLRRIHQLPVPATAARAHARAHADPVRNITGYVALRHAAGLSWPDWFPALFARARAERARHAGRVDYALTHHDFNPWNILLPHSGDDLMLDWEYAGLGDPMFDLVSAFVHWQLAADARTALLLAYGADDSARARIPMLECLFHLREFTWAGAMLALGSHNANVQEQWDREAEHLIRY